MTLSPHISKQFESSIWRMEIDPATNILFAEIRDEEQKQVSFSAIDLNTGAIYFESLATPERWLTGIECAYDGVLLIHYYRSENGPTHKGLLAIDVYNRGNYFWLILKPARRPEFMSRSFIMSLKMVFLYRCKCLLNRCHTACSCNTLT